MRPSRSFAQFDSASAMLRATARFLHGQDFSGLGMRPSPLPLAPAVNLLPPRLREQVYIWSGWGEALPARKLRQLRAEAVAASLVGSYPSRTYPAVFLGSSNGAVVHLAAALGVPWLPQTLLVPVRWSGVHPDEPRDALQAGADPARALLERNPELQLHHMHDPNQDRLMVHRMAYFRVKWRRLPGAYERFLERHLRPGGTVYLVECGLRWPVTRVGERHLFQFGALGGATVEEFLRGGPRVEEYLARYRSHRRRWEPPEPDAEAPEAEWGFEPTLRGDLERVADRLGLRLRRIAFEQPEDLSPTVADLHRRWLDRLGRPSGRLLAESFLMVEPYWALRTGSVPFWMVFNTEPSARALERYLDAAEPFDEILLALFAHGVESAGLAPVERWRSLLGRARERGGFLGLDQRRFPRDFAVLHRYHAELKRLQPRYGLPDPLAPDELERSLATLSADMVEQ